MRGGNFPALHAEVFRTERGTPYLKEPGVVVIGVTEVNLEGIQKFLEGFDPSLGFQDYLKDPKKLPDPEGLCKFAGQLCYMSLGLGRTKNDRASEYFGKIKSEKHGSVLEHVQVTFFLYGISRDITHELVRHRAGFAFSQVSQRYVSGRTLRFVEGREYQEDEELHRLFCGRIDRVAEEYTALEKLLMKKQQEGIAILSGQSKTDLRKKVQQAARSLLPNETEAPIVVTANVRAWRHFIETRASPHADVDMRILAFKTFLCLREVAPILFDDYVIKDLPDGTKVVETPYLKV